MDRLKTARIMVVAGASSLAALEVLLFATDLFWVKGWFYILAWWCFIPLVDGWVYLRKGSSLILARPREFLLLVPWSVAVWLFFELANLRLRNWEYVGIEPDPFVRWPGYVLAYGTVLPGIFEVYELLGTTRLFAGARMKPAKVSVGTLRMFSCLGWAFLFLPVAFPSHAFPLIWGAWIFLLEPYNRRRGLPSLLGDAERGEPRRFLLLLAAGAVCGLLWEFWNFWAVAKWRYTVPGMEELKLFEMPVAGFFGFPPFAVECWCVMNYVGCFRGGRMWEEGSRESEVRSQETKELTSKQWAVIAVAGIVFAAAVCRAIDLWTIKEYL